MHDSSFINFTFWPTSLFWRKAVPNTRHHCLLLSQCASEKVVALSIGRPGASCLGGQMRSALQAPSPSALAETPESAFLLLWGPSSTMRLFPWEVSMAFIINSKSFCRVLRDLPTLPSACLVIPLFLFHYAHPQPSSLLSGFWTYSLPPTPGPTSMDSCLNLGCSSSQSSTRKDLPLKV